MIAFMRAVPATSCACAYGGNALRFLDYRALPPRILARVLGTVRPIRRAITSIRARVTVPVADAATDRRGA